MFTTNRHRYFKYWFRHNITEILPLRIPKFVSSHLKRHRRDDDGMPNYLDHFYGGLGEYIPK
jgi:hypothetical protein